MFIDFLKRILSFLFPISCSGCGKTLAHIDKYRICPACAEKLFEKERLYCVKCGKPLPDGGERCFNCRKEPKFYFERLFSAGAYEGLMRDLLRKFKYSYRDFLSVTFGRLLVTVIDGQPLLRDIDVVVPVPLHWGKRLLRGFNQSELLARKVSEHLQRPFLKDVLIRRKMTKPQFGLSRDERLINLSDAFKIKNAGLIKNKRILLIDDIATTCATINQCAKMLKESGAGKVYGLVVARD